MEVKAILYMQNRWINRPKQKHNDKHNDGVTIQWSVFTLIYFFATGTGFKQGLEMIGFCDFICS